RPPPRSTPFPYTTLFRSRGDVRRDAGAGRPPGDARSRASEAGWNRSESVRVQAEGAAEAATHRGTEAGAAAGRRAAASTARAAADRKSTRLNSSHVSISY